jgi:hypothetical protein
MNTTQKINRLRKARGMPPMGYEEFATHYAKRTPAATMRGFVFEAKFPIEVRRRVREVFNVSAVLPA